MDFVCKLYDNTYAVHVTVALVGVATLNLALPAPLGPSEEMSGVPIQLSGWAVSSYSFPSVLLRLVT